MSKIQVLPENLINQIAAGEVVERPASVVKELVENAFDAGATRVRIAIEGGGIARLEVLDDGSGMEPFDARLAVERHATSKIRSLDDLARIGTMGFRGEALASIASVSRLTLSTSPDESGLGTEVVADRGGAPQYRPTRQPRGTRVVVEDLFGNVPARRKFLKSPEAETRAVVKGVTTSALSRPEVAVTLLSGSRSLLDLPRSENAADRFADLVGGAALGHAQPVFFELFGMTLSGAVSAPDRTFASRSYQWFFVNGRAVRDATVSHAAQLAAREILRTDRFPAFALFLTTDPTSVDVNVHPQKTEVRFRHVDHVHSVVHRGLAAALSGGKGATSFLVDRLEGPASVSTPYSTDSPAAAPSFVAETVAPYGNARGERQPLGEPTSGSFFRPAASPVSRSSYGSRPETASPIGPLVLLGQYRESFLIAEGASGLVLVDQHVAHERVRYEAILERLRAGRAGSALSSQRLLIPFTYEATPDEAALLASSDELLYEAGFVVSELSGRTFQISAAPADCPPASVGEFLRDFLARLAERHGTRDTPDGDELDKSRQTLAAALACRGAITINTRLLPEAATRLLSDLVLCRDPFTCPHGRPILLTLSHLELEKRFGRRS